MSKLIFPDGVTYTFKYLTSGDLLPNSFSGPIPSELYRYCYNSVIDIRFDTKTLTNTKYLFNTASSLRYVELFDTSNVTDMSKMFYGCSSLITVPKFDTSKVTDMSYMFYGCSSLITVPKFDTSKVTNMNAVFYSCGALITIPKFDTSKVTDMSGMLQQCSSLTSVPQLDCSKIAAGSNINIFGSGTMNVTDLGGFKDLGKPSNFNKPSYFLKYCSKLTKESVMNVINNLYDRASAGYSVVALPFNAASLALLSDEEKAIATNKGWSLS